MKKKESKNADITRRDFMKKTSAAAAAMGVSAFAPRLVKSAFPARTVLSGGYFSIESSQREGTTIFTS